MFPKISARWSLLEPSFRYLSPGSEGEKSRALDHMWQIPFIHSVQFVISSNYIYMQESSSYFFLVVRKSVLVLCVFEKWTCALSETLNPRFRTITQVVLSFILCCIFTRSTWQFSCAFSEQTKSAIISSLPIKLLSPFLFFFGMSQTKITKRRQ